MRSTADCTPTSKIIESNLETAAATASDSTSNTPKRRTASMKAAPNRLPRPASVRSSSTPSGVWIVTTSSMRATT